MKRWFVTPILGVVGCLAFVVPAHAADNGASSAGATSTTVLAAGTPTTVVVTKTTETKEEDDKTGLWGLLGLLGLAGLAGLAKKKQPTGTYTTSTPVTGTAPPRADGASGTTR
jgi:hypothetical protein